MIIRAHRREEMRKIVDSWRRLKEMNVGRRLWDGEEAEAASVHGIVFIKFKSICNF